VGCNKGTEEQNWETLAYPRVSDSKLISMLEIINHADAWADYGYYKEGIIMNHD
jgi:hypothetical protein